MKRFIGGFLTAVLLMSMSIGIFASGDEPISATLKKALQITLDGKDLSFKDATGTTVYPMIYQGTTYLPIRALSETLGLKVGWNDQTQTVTLDDPKVADGAYGDMPVALIPSGNYALNVADSDIILAIYNNLKSSDELLKVEYTVVDDKSHMAATEYWLINSDTLSKMKVALHSEYSSIGTAGTILDMDEQFSRLTYNSTIEDCHVSAYSHTLDIPWWRDASDKNVIEYKVTNAIGEILYTN